MPGAHKSSYYGRNRRVLRRIKKNSHPDYFFKGAQGVGMSLKGGALLAADALEDGSDVPDGTPVTQANEGRIP